ncbi:diaminopimelate epimerase [Streptomyces mashuensis]|uniref:Diaminopimelate epimerase n=1 Tax=Streptomyces mashuensis TaxID=33904 RepID=A0A919AUQ2_9ACTN|nr:diaminopimelate epimerase [Streptomyces mashuensis]GHF24550.1 diaminopimelate epimerase [Streptomyces mashuensis]
MTTPQLDGLPFAKGHGCQNSFLLLPDPAGCLDLTPDEIRRLADTHTGAGADGILRVVRCTATPEAAAMAGAAEWFMDYRNADGSLGAMCGNGIRLFARYLVDAGHCAPGTLAIATRAGVRHVRVPPESDGAQGQVSVVMGSPAFPGPDHITIVAAGRRWPATHVDMGNPHAVVFVDDLADAGTLHVPPTTEPADAYPHGFTTEFVAVRGPGHLALRVHERGVGETRACGTGACAAVAAHRRRAHDTRAADYRVDLLGGRLHVAVAGDGTMTLAGPAVITAHGVIGLPGSVESTDPLWELEGVR